MLISFSGLDGAGKSTLIARLRAELEHQGRAVTVLHMDDHVGVYAWLRAVRNRVLGAHRNGGRATVAREAGPYPRGLRGSVRQLRDAVVWSTLVRRLIYPIDLAIFLVYRLALEQLGRRVLIMDRYFYDHLVDVVDGRGWGWLRLLHRLTPTPDVAVLLVITPEEAYARKGEYSVGYLRARRDGFDRVFPWVPSAMLVSSRDLEAAERLLTGAVVERLEL